MKFAAVSAIALGAVSCYASAVPRQVGTQCTNGPVQCCNQLQNYNSIDTNTLTAIGNLFGGSVSKTFQGQLGIGCTSVGVMGAAGNQCSQQPVCCQNVESSGIFGWNCSPVTLNG